MIQGLYARFVRKPFVTAHNLVRKSGRRQSKHIGRTWKISRERTRNGLRRSYAMGVSAWRRLMSVHKPFVRLKRRAVRTGEIRAARSVERQVEREIRAIARTRDTLVVGPWFSEVGFEALYWLPFIRWVAAEFNLNPSNVVAVSRGGVASWYRDMAATYVEIFDHMDPASLAARNEARRVEGDGSRKQLGLSNLDRELIGYAVARAGLGAHTVLHPSLMYRLLKRFWLGQQPLTWAQTFTRPAQLNVPAPRCSAELPADYIAVKFYTAASMPDAPATRAAMRAIVEAASRLAPVVLLDTGLVFDDHDDYHFGERHRVVNIRHLMRPSNNLELQTAVISRARCFVGTCGSIAWLAPLLGVPTVAVMADDKFLHPHLYFARQAYRTAGAASFMTVDIRALETLELAKLMTEAAGRV